MCSKTCARVQVKQSCSTVVLTLSVTTFLSVSCKTRRHLQTSQTTLKPAKYQTNHLLIGQKLHCYFPEYIFDTPQHFPCPSRAKKKIDAFFDVSGRFRISPSPLHSSLPSLIADYNSSHKLLTQLQTLMNFLRRIGLTLLHWRFYER